MAENKKGFILYADQRSLFDKLPNEKAGELIKHIFSYVNDENPEPVDLLIDIAFDPIKNQLKRDLKKFEETKKQRVEAGKKSAATRRHQRDSTKLNEAQRDSTPLNEAQRSSTKATVIDNVTVKENVTVNVIKKREANFEKEILPYFEKGLIDGDDLKKFNSYWTEHGKNDRKMRFEKEKSFSIERRISTWLKNKDDWNKEKNSAKKEKLRITEEDIINLSE